MTAVGRSIWVDAIGKHATVDRWFLSGPSWWLSGRGQWRASIARAGEHIVEMIANLVLFIEVEISRTMELGSMASAASIVDCRAPVDRQNVEAIRFQRAIVFRCESTASGGWRGARLGRASATEDIGPSIALTSFLIVVETCRTEFLGGDHIGADVIEV